MEGLWQGRSVGTVWLFIITMEEILLCADFWLSNAMGHESQTCFLPHSGCVSPSNTKTLILNVFSS